MPLGRLPQAETCWQAACLLMITLRAQAPKPRGVPTHPFYLLLLGGLHLAGEQLAFRLQVSKVLRQPLTAERVSDRFKH